jgi:hypothetical protein
VCPLLLCTAGLCAWLCCRCHALDVMRLASSAGCHCQGLRCSYMYSCVFGRQSVTFTSCVHCRLWLRVLFAPAVGSRVVLCEHKHGVAQQLVACTADWWHNASKQAHNVHLQVPTAASDVISGGTAHTGNPIVKQYVGASQDCTVTNCICWQ